MSGVTQRRSGLQFRVEIPAGTVNDSYVDIAEIQILKGNYFQKTKDGTDSLAEDSTLQDWDESVLENEEIWANAISTHSVYNILKTNVQILTTQIAGISNNRGKFVGTSLAERVTTGREVEFIVLSTNSYSIFVGGTDDAPTYDDASGTALTKLIAKGTYFARVKLTGVEDTALPSEWVYSNSVSFNDWFPTDISPKVWHEVRNISGTLKLTDVTGAQVYSGGSISIDNGRKLWSISAAQPGAAYASVARPNIANEMVIAFAGKGDPATNSYYVISDNNAGGIVIAISPSNIAKTGSYGTVYMAVNTTGTHWTWAADGYFICIIIINTAKTAFGGGSPVNTRWNKGANANAMVTAGVKVFTNKDGNLYDQTGIITFPTVADATIGIENIKNLSNVNTTAQLFGLLIAEKSTFTNDDITELYNYLKKKTVIV